MDSAERLKALEHSNLFLVSLDGRGEWYRYHNLFRELVHAELVASDPSALPDLNRRAATWCIERGLIEDALEYAWATGDPAELADLLQPHYLELARAGKFTTFNGWLQRLPDSVLTRTATPFRQRCADVDDGGSAGADTPSLRSTRRSRT